jgi:FtsP/CotA-like multicopper oxidase with cupredoxin domain
VVGLAATVAIVVPLAFWWHSSLVPSTYSVMDMGYPDYGGGTVSPHHQHATGTSLATLTGPRSGTPDVALTLTARRQRFTLASGQPFEGYTLNGTSPGPQIQARQRDLVQVTLINQDVSDGVALHWHGVDVPNAEDGVAGVTQDAVPPGGRYVYRFVVEDAGTYWYHSHQVSHEQVKGGLFGTLVVQPPERATGAPSEVVAAVHSYEGLRTVSGRTGVLRVSAGPGATVRVRVVNTDNGPLLAWVSGSGFRVLAVDGRDVHEPGELRDKLVVVTAGGRTDLEVTVPADGSAARVELGGGSAVLLGPAGSQRAASQEPTARVDMLSYGTPVALPFDQGRLDRNFSYRIGRRPGLIDGMPGLWWTINGHLFPDVPMFTVAEGDVVRMTVRNTSGQVHPMHLHGHHAVVLSRDGVAATGSPWWVDSLNVEDGETFEIAFLADNPGVWIDHCHNLDHAAEGLIAHLAYTGVSEPYLVGRDVGAGTRNEPE